MIPLPRLYVDVTRLGMIAITLVLIIVTPLLLFVMLCDSIFGNVQRAAFMAVAIDECANSMLGGDPRVTISARVGYGLQTGASWAPFWAKVIDGIFGKGHCASQAGDYQEYEDGPPPN